MSELENQHCVPCEGGVPPLNEARVTQLLGELKGWTLTDDKTTISKQFEFKNYYKTMAFVNAVAYLAHQENHHPDLQVSYNQCTVNYSTHAINGLSDNDFICANQVDKL